MRSLAKVFNDFLYRRNVELGALVGVAVSLQLAAAAGVAYIAGFSAVRRALGHFTPLWLLGVAGGLVVSFVGYFFAYRGIYEVDDGPHLRPSKMATVVIAGFGGFLTHAGTAVDRYALQSAGSDDRDAKVRVASLGGLEHGIMGLLGCVASIVVLCTGRSAPPLDVLLPWAVIPAPGFLIAFSLANRYHSRLHEARGGWRGILGVFVDSICLIRSMFSHVGKYWPVLGGMGVFWIAEGFAAWSGLAAFGYRMNGAQLAVGLATGMVFTRRTGPLAGAGILMLVLSLALWYSGAPLAPALCGIFVYRMITVWAPLPASLAVLPALRRMGEENKPEEPLRTSGEPALRAEHAMPDPR